MKWVDDGDTIDVRLRTLTGKWRTVRVRIIGVQAMEQTVYDKNPRKRRGECHALPATTALERLIKRSHGRVRLSAQDPASQSRERLWRSVAVRIGGTWHDVGRRLVRDGHALWIPNWVEYAWNQTYATLAQQAALNHLNLWQSDACAKGPSQDAPLRVTVHPDGKGFGYRNANKEWVEIANLSPVTPVPLARWWLRDSLLRYHFPAWAAILPGGRITVYVGVGTATRETLYWGLHRTIFENPTNDARAMGDGAYLFDPQGDLRAWSQYPCYVGCTATPP